MKSQHTGTPKEWVNTSRSWYFDAVLNIVLPIAFAVHGGARRENVLLKKRPQREHWVIPVILTQSFLEGRLP